MQSYVLSVDCFRSADFSQFFYCHKRHTATHTCIFLWRGHTHTNTRTRRPEVAVKCTLSLLLLPFYLSPVVSVSIFLVCVFLSFSCVVCVYLSLVCVCLSVCLPMCVCVCVCVLWGVCPMAES